ncbi:uncharacterized protein LOC100210562 isoform X2 [Hydra vulgaris]|uniref:Uncharacterized protein LOC100210562 isoform X2 n=1 Tax=Hydra vulgaris TaxID=6087 RepID=A0ABM4BTU3_HYDVU
MNKEISENVLENENEDYNILNKELSNDYSDELSDEERVLLYEKALSFKQLGSNNHALLCFLGCLKGLKPSSKTKFTMLPQCLTHISEIYASAGDYQRAVEFMQGTKLYYETAIIEAGIQVDEYKKETGSGYQPLDLDPCLDEARRANEYERLSHSCLEQQKFQLALEYCGKATQLRQKAYGNEHQLTMKSLDMFTLIYAEMGKSQYSEAMSKYGETSKFVKEDEAMKKTSQDNLKEAKKNKKEVKIVEEEVKKIEEMKVLEKENLVEEPREENRTKKVQFSPIVSTRTITCDNAPLSTGQWHMLTFFFVSTILAVITTILWCHISGSSVCLSFRYLFSQ